MFKLSFILEIGTYSLLWAENSQQDFTKIIWYIESLDFDQYLKVPLTLLLTKSGEVTSKSILEQEWPLNDQGPGHCMFSQTLIYICESKLAVF